MVKRKDLEEGIKRFGGKDFGKEECIIFCNNQAMKVWTDDQSVRTIKEFKEHKPTENIYDIEVYDNEVIYTLSNKILNLQGNIVLESDHTLHRVRVNKDEILYADIDLSKILERKIWIDMTGKDGRWDVVSYLLDKSRELELF